MLSSINLLQGDCLEQMNSLQSDSIDSLITDPPYGIKFMSKKWDDDCPSVEIWQESLRVLKPGGHALVFSGTRTIDLIMGRMREAGYEIRDCITWLYGSGFPKSHNISKGIDKKFGAQFKSKPAKGVGFMNNKDDGYNTTLNQLEKVGESTDQAKQWDGWGTALKPSTEHCVLARKNGVDIVRFNVINKTLCQYLLHVLTVEKNLMSSQAELKEALNIVQCLAEKNTSTLENLLDQMDMLQSKLMGSSFLNTVILWKNVLKESLENMSKFTMSMETNLIIELKILNYCLLETIQGCTTKEEMKQSGQQLNVLSVESLFKNVLIKLSYILNIDVSSNVLDNLSPACEFIVLARKPLSEKTVVNNVLKHGTGGINIDECRVEALPRKTGTINKHEISGKTGIYGKDLRTTRQQEYDKKQEENPQGRFPANLILDEEAGKMLDEQSGITKSTGGDGYKNSMFCGGKKTGGHGLGDKGGASRFFYCAKTSKSERNKGLDGEAITTDDGRNKSIDNPYLRGETKRQNNHPTVKPQKLMQYLCKLITPPNGTILDCFMGSGSTGVAAKTLGFDFMGIEREQQYYEIAKQRIDNE